MAHARHIWRVLPAWVLGNAAVFAQTTSTVLPDVLVAGRASPVLSADAASVGGLNLPLAQTPQSVTVLSADALRATGAQTWSQALRLDAALADNYNTTGYIESLSVRGFALDALNNFRYNGLATSNYLPLMPEALERIELLKGVAGLQAGVASPGGLVNLVGKAPGNQPFAEVNIEVDQRGGSLVHLDQNWADEAAGLRINLVRQQLHPAALDANGVREGVQVSWAQRLDETRSAWMQIAAQSKRQPSVPGLGLLDTNGDGIGDKLPAPDPTLNLNNQSWSQPFEARSVLWQIGWDYALRDQWRWQTALGMQRIRVNDRVAFPDGCSSGPVYVYPGWCGNGDVDLYDYRSDEELRSVNSWSTSLYGPLWALGRTHHLRMELSGHVARTELAPWQAYNYVGTINGAAPAPVPADPSLTVLNVNSDERTTEAAFNLRTEWGAAWNSFVGWRQSWLARSSARSDGSQAVAYTQSVGVPWLGLSWRPDARTTLYLTRGRGVELEAVPNRPQNFVNAGQILPALTSTQTEFGAKWQWRPHWTLNAAVFSIDKPFADDMPPADPQSPAERVAGGKMARHQGLELGASGRISPNVALQASLMALDATYVNALDPALVGRPVTNQARLKASGLLDIKLHDHPGWAVTTLLTFESAKPVLPDGSVWLDPSWQLDLGLRHEFRMGAIRWTWRAQLDNALDRRYWREAPTTAWGGVYLFPAAPGTFRLGLSAEL